MRSGKLILAALAVWLPATAALSQNPDAPNEPAPSIRTQTSLVFVPALVRSSSGALVYTLKADDFVITDNGVPQRVMLEPDAGKAPLALVVVVEIGGAAVRQFQKYSSIAPPLAPMLYAIIGNVPHQVAVVTFDSHPRLLQNFTFNTQEAENALRSLRPGCTRQHQMVDCEAASSIHDVPLGDNGAAILDSLETAVTLLRGVPDYYRRAILLVSETLDRGSETTIAQAVRDITDTNTTIYSFGFSTAKSEAAHYAARQLPTQPSGRPTGLLSLENHTPNPTHGCMGKSPQPDPDGPANRWAQAYDCLAQLAPPLTLVKMAAIATVDGLARNVPETVAQMTGGEYFKFNNARELDRALAEISNHLPNRYQLSFYPQSPIEGLRVIKVGLPEFEGMQITARSRYWADAPNR